jgi:putative Holliday junction resolvase
LPNDGVALQEWAPLKMAQGWSGSGLRRSPFQHRNPFFGIAAGTYNRDVPSEPTHSPAAQHPRVLGLDVGSKRIGLAISDLLGITAQGLETIQRQNKRLDFGQLEKVIREYTVTAMVVGYPLRMSGAEGIQAEKMQRFAEELRQRFQLPVHLWDERLSSAQANRLLRETEMSIKRRGQVVDQMAAVLILQSWMDAKGS